MIRSYGSEEANCRGENENFRLIWLGVCVPFAAAFVAVSESENVTKKQTVATLLTNVNILTLLVDTLIVQNAVLVLLLVLL